MTAIQLIDFMYSIENEDYMFEDRRIALDIEKYDIAVQLERDIRNNKLNKAYQDVCQKLEVIAIMQRQRLYLLTKAQKRGVL